MPTWLARGDSTKSCVALYQIWQLPIAIESAESISVLEWASAEHTAVLDGKFSEDSED